MLRRREIPTSAAAMVGLAAGEVHNRRGSTPS
jgi:hypothetical protein